MIWASHVLARCIFVVLFTVEIHCDLFYSVQILLSLLKMNIVRVCFLMIFCLKMYAVSYMLFGPACQKDHGSQWPVDVYL